jgi:hypothetical protein
MWAMMQKLRMISIRDRLFFQCAKIAILRDKTKKSLFPKEQALEVI